MKAEQWDTITKWALIIQISLVAVLFLFGVLLVGGAFGAEHVRCGGLWRYWDTKWAHMIYIEHRLSDYRNYVFTDSDSQGKKDKIRACAHCAEGELDLFKKMSATESREFLKTWKESHDKFDPIPCEDAS